MSPLSIGEFKQYAPFATGKESKMASSHCFKLHVAAAINKLMNSNVARLAHCFRFLSAWQCVSCFNAFPRQNDPCSADFMLAAWCFNRRSIVSPARDDYHAGSIRDWPLQPCAVLATDALQPCLYSLWSLLLTFLHDIPQFATRNTWQKLYGILAPGAISMKWNLKGLTIAYCQ